MDNTKHNQPAAAQDSDDLIAELARLVAQDARNSSGVQAREEPRFAPAPADEPGQGASAADDRSYQAPAHQEPRFEPQVPVQPDIQDDRMPAFNFGFGAPSQEPQSQQDAAVDPIAELIADAEVEAYDRDLNNDVEWAGQAEDQIWPQDEVHQPAEQYGYDAGNFSPAAVEQPEPFGRHGDDTQSNRDPLSEIEALIGEAARANSGEAPLPGGRRVRSSFLDETPTDAAVDAAESAILAAAAATGTQVRRTEPEQQVSQSAPQPVREPAPQPVRAQPQPEPRFEPEPAFEQGFDGDDRESGDAHIPDPLFTAPVRDQAPRAQEDEIEFEDDSFEYAEERPRRKIPPFVVPVIAGTAILGLLGGGYFAFFSGPSDPGEAPILTANTEPLKQEAEVTPTQTTATESVVFNEIEGNTASPDEEELVSRDQTGGASGTDVAGVLATDAGTTELANRPVRTVTVRPDGTIVQAEDSVAGSTVLPVDRPDVPPVPNSTLTADPIGEAIAMAMAGEPTAGAAMSLQQRGANPAEASPTEAVPADTAASDTAADATAPVAADGNLNVPRPIPRPDGLTGPAAPAPAPTQVAAAPAQAVTTPAAAEPAAATSSTVGAWVQLSSQRTEEEARAGIPTLQSLYGSLFNGATPEVSRVDLGERGIYYRVRLPQPTLAEANSVCGAIRGQGGDCFVMDN